MWSSEVVKMIREYDLLGLLLWYDDFSGRSEVGMTYVMEAILSWTQIDDISPPPAPFVFTANARRVLAHLIERGCGDLSVRDHFDRTALMIAARTGCVPLVEFLVEMGADPNDRDGQDTTALMYAMDEGCEDVVSWLMPRTNADPVVLAVRLQSYRMLEYCLRGEPRDLREALLLAANRDEVFFLDTLIEYGADPHDPEVLDVAIHGNAAKVVRRLLCYYGVKQGLIRGKSPIESLLTYIDRSGAETMQYLMINPMPPVTCVYKTRFVTRRCYWRMVAIYHGMYPCAVCGTSGYKMLTVRPPLTARWELVYVLKCRALLYSRLHLNRVSSDLIGPKARRVGMCLMIVAVNYYIHLPVELWYEIFRFFFHCNVDLESYIKI